MNYKEAIALKNASRHLIGKTDRNGYKITDIIIVPADQDKRNDFMLCYIQSHDASYCLMNYIADDLIVISIDNRYLHDDYVLFYDIIQPELELAE